MRRIRFFRILLPAALILFVILVVVSLQNRPDVHGRSDVDAPQAFVRGLDVVTINRDEAAFDVRAELVEPLPGGGYHAERIERLGIARTGRGPLIVEAVVADVEGPVGERKMRIRDRVVVRDPEAGLLLVLPLLEVDEEAGEARADREVRFEGPGVRGRGSRLVYGLREQPSTLFEPVIEDAGGARLVAERAVLYDGLRDVEFQGRVQGERGEEGLSAERLRVWRGKDDRLRRVLASGGVRVSLVATPGSAPVQAVANELDCSMDPNGRPQSFRLQDDASLKRGGDSLSAELIEGQREGGTVSQWLVTAQGTVYLQRQLGAEVSWLRTETLRASLDDRMDLREAQAEGGVQFEGPLTRAEADSGVFRSTETGGDVRLVATGNRKARLARDRTRVAAASIVTDLRGERLEAENRVEATLLPGSDRDSAPGTAGLFRASEAIHFVAGRLSSEQRGDRLRFSDAVRGWQGERNLSAEVVELDQRARTLRARRQVTTRVPRDRAATGAGETDYIQIHADRLDYDENSRLAVYAGRVRLTVLEGWLEAERMEVRLSTGDSAIEEVWAHDGVRIEFRDPDKPGSGELTLGSADRLSYVPADQAVRLFGDRQPATVRRLGDSGATTSGRVLRYRLDVGTLEVEPGEGAPARIRGS